MFRYSILNYSTNNTTKDSRNNNMENSISERITKNFINMKRESPEKTNSGRKVAVLLTGCGRFDGSEVLESVSCLIALAKNKLKCDCFSFNKNQYDVIDSITRKPVKEMFCS